MNDIRRSVLLCSCLLCVLCVSVVNPLCRRVARRWAASRRAGRSAAPRPSSPSTAAGSPTPRRSSSTTPGFTRHEAGGRQRQPGQGDGARSPPDCRLGEHAVRVRTATGISELRTFWVGALPVVDEKEPNSEFATPQKIALNVTVHGVVDSEDVDYFAVECKKGQRLSRRGRGDAARRTRFFDPYVAILDAKRFELATSRRLAAARPGRRAARSSSRPTASTSSRSARAPTAATAACQYRLHVGTFPRPTAVVPAGGKPGEEVEVTLPRRPGRRDQAEGEAARRPPTRTFRRALPGRRTASRPSGIPFRVSDVPQRRSRPSRTTPTPTATTGDRPRWRSTASSTKPGDVDCFRFAAKKGQVFDVHCYARRLGSPLDPVMTSPSLGGGGDRRQRRRGRAGQLLPLHRPGGRRVRRSGVTDHLRKGGPTYFYRVEFTPVAPRRPRSASRRWRNYLAGAADDRGAEGQPLRDAGDRSAAPTSAASWRVGLDKLPPGVTLAADAMDRGPRRWSRWCSRRAGRPGRRAARPTCTAKPADPKVAAAQAAFDADVELQHRARTTRRSTGRTTDRGRGRRDRGGAVHDRDRRAEGAAGAERVDEPEGRRRSGSRGSRRRSRSTRCATRRASASGGVGDHPAERRPRRCCR